VLPPDAVVALPPSAAKHRHSDSEMESMSRSDHRESRSQTVNDRLIDQAMGEGVARYALYTS
jgi:hypothetical protein